MTSLSEPADALVALEGEATAGGYVGLATRVIAFTLDAAVISLVAIIVGAGASLVVQLFHFPEQLRTILQAIAAVAAVLWSIGYFVVFWSTTGQTPGSRVMQIRVVAADGVRIRPRRALVRCVGLVLAALPLFAGYVLILFDAKRRGFQDRFAGTVVVEAPQLSVVATRQANMRATYEKSRNRPPGASP